MNQRFEKIMSTVSFPKSRDMPEATGRLRLSIFPFKMKKISSLAFFSLLAQGLVYTHAVDFTSTLEIPPPESLKRIQTREDQRDLDVRYNFVSLATGTAEAIGTDYTILTDRQDEKSLQALERLKAHHQGTLIQVPDLGVYYSSAKQREALGEKLLTTKFLAIAPRPDSFRETTVLGLFHLLRGLDSDSDIDVFPSFLLATDPQKLNAIVEQAITYKPVPAPSIQPVAISLIDSKRRINSLQKAGYFRSLFAQEGKTTPTFLIYRPKAHDAPSLGHDQVWYQQLSRQNNIVRKLPEPFESHFQKSHLVLMHGHGTVGECCRIASEVLDRNLGGKVLLSGSCFSVPPQDFDWPLKNEDQFSDATGFSIKALEQGAVCTFGHMRFSNGFRYLEPVFKELYRGASNGEAYHQLLNAALRYSPEAALRILNPVGEKRKPIQNNLLYILLGDPALVPFLPENPDSQPASPPIPPKEKTSERAAEESGP